MNFEWDESKSNSNKSKHGIDFETAKNNFQMKIVLKLSPHILQKIYLSVQENLTENYGLLFLQ